MNSLAKLFDQLVKNLKALPPGRALFLAGFSLAAVLGGGYWINQVYRAGYEPLYANLNPEEAGRIVAKLKEAKISYELGADGASILVPGEHLHETRLSLAMQGLPSEGSPGFELFDRAKLGVSGYVEKMQFRRALEGELSRTIMHLEGVLSARVHLAIPEPSPFVGDVPPASASVVLHMRPGSSLSSGQVRGVVHLISGAVDGLRPEQVSILDGEGRLLRNTESDELVSNDGEVKRSTERMLENRAQEMLDRVFGIGKAIARVDVTLDMDKFESVHEFYEPQPNAIRSLRELREQAGAKGGGGSTQGKGGGQEKSDRQVTYELNKKVENFVKRPGAIKKLSVAVMVPDSQNKGKALEGLQQGISAALGLDEKRGDRISIQSLPFVVPADFDEKAWQKEEWTRQLVRDGKRYGILLISAIFIFMALRSLIQTLGAVLAPAALAVSESGVPPSAEMTADSAPAAEKNGRSAPPRPRMGSVPEKEGPDPEQLKASLTIMAEGQPDVFARTLKKWVVKKVEEKQSANGSTKEKEEVHA